MDISIRRANAGDKEFLMKVIAEAEKSGGDTISYCSIFSITEEQFMGVLSDILDEDMDGQELCIGSYLIAEIGGERAAAMGAWVEKENGMSSAMIRRNLLMHFLGKDIMLNAAQNMKMMGEVDVQRSERALQLEIAYTLDKFRGHGLYGKLATEHIRLKKEEGVPFDRVQGIIYKTNTSPYSALTRLGFTKAQERCSTNPEILKLLPSDTKILMEKRLE